MPDSYRLKPHGGLLQCCFGRPRDLILCTAACLAQGKDRHLPHTQVHDVVFSGVACGWTVGMPSSDRWRPQRPPFVAVRPEGGQPSRRHSRAGRRGQGGASASTTPTSPSPSGIGGLSIPLCGLLLNHNGLTEGGHASPVLLPCHHGRHDGRQGKVLPDPVDQDSTLRGPSGALGQRMLGGVLVTPAVMTLRRRLATDPIQILTEATMPGEYLRQTVGDG